MLNDVSAANIPIEQERNDLEVLGIFGTAFSNRLDVHLVACLPKSCGIGRTRASAKLNVCYEQLHERLIGTVL